MTKQNKSSKIPSILVTLITISTSLLSNSLLSQETAQQSESIKNQNNSTIKTETVKDSLTEFESKVLESEYLLDPELQGMTLEFTEKPKKVTIELPDGTFFEINFKIPYYKPTGSSFISVQDIKKLDAISTELTKLKNLPISEFIQPEQQDRYTALINDINSLSDDFGQRLFIFSLSEEDLIELKEIKKTE